MPTVSVPPPYRGPTRGEASIPVDAATVRECLNAVDVRYPGFAELIFDGNGVVHRFVRLFLNEEPLDVRSLDVPVGPEDTLTVIAAIAGGSRGPALSTPSV